MTRAKRYIFFWFPTLAWMAVIYFLSSFHKMQASPVGWQDFIVRKTAHFIEYLVLCILINRSLKNTSSLSLVKRLVLALALTVLYAISDEYHQTFVNGRTGKIFDIGIDTLGAFFGLIFYWKLVKLLPEGLQKLI